MAEDGEVAFTSVKDRIAAMTLNEVGRSPILPHANGQPTSLRVRPPPPAVPPRPAVSRNQTTNVPPIQSNAPTTARHIGNQPTPTTKRPLLPPPQINKNTDDSSERPPLPARPSQESAKSPPLPPRKQSEDGLSRRESIESVSSVRSSQSSFSAASRSTSFSGASRRTSTDAQQNRVKAPPFDPSKLPVILAKKEEEVKEQARAPLKPTYSSPNVIPRQQSPSSTEVPPPLPSRPPLPARPSARSGQHDPPKRSALDFGMNRNTETPPAVPARPTSTPNGAPPPIPLSSRPDLAALQASKPKPTVTGVCLKCRDFSGPDTHATRFPRISLPTHDLAWLAHQLTAPFSSPTDKARVLFTWLHHNIAYNVADFSPGTIKPSTPASTLASGLAVCEGYAALFAALAMHAGLEAIVVSGHGKGTGYAPPPGAAANVPLPPYNGTHAWNAVRIDGGEWKLIDCCWGAGAVNGKGEPYIKRFAPECFTMDNNEFGEKHFPEDGSKFFRTDGRARISWEEYLLLDAGGRPTVYTGVDVEHGISERSFLPKERKIRVHDPAAQEVVRFQFGKVCEHWDMQAKGQGKPYLFLLKVGGRDGRDEGYLPFQFNGQVWWVDCPRRELGAPGMQVHVYTFSTLNGRDMRGGTVRDWEERTRCINGKGSSWGFGGVAMWELV